MTEPLNDASNGGGGGNGRDWRSLRAWANAIGIIGIPGTIAVFLVYIGATEIPKLVRETEKLSAEVQQNQKILLEQNERMDYFMRLAQRICSNTAKDEMARQRCFD